MRCWPDDGKATRRRSQSMTPSPLSTFQPRLDGIVALRRHHAAPGPPTDQRPRRPGSRHPGVVSAQGTIGHGRRPVVQNLMLHPSRLRASRSVVILGPMQVRPRPSSSTSESKTVCDNLRNAGIWPAASPTHVRKASSISNNRHFSSYLLT